MLEILALQVQKIGIFYTGVLIKVLSLSGSYMLFVFKFGTLVVDLISVLNLSCDNAWKSELGFESGGWGLLQLGKICNSLVQPLLLVWMLKRKWENTLLLLLMNWRNISTKLFSDKNLFESTPVHLLLNRESVEAIMMKVIGKN
ncbi:hypothetical protein CTI12_AA542050 [Artemisia annua]|uniref:Uncharacterized protein n=1 Tax=Artemisia annua TaxID=35608 RepID=A0A2U1L131_ARTAN|nr:hypothetical protein CTI12_AA542050 [Artemisia annua]